MDVIYVPGRMATANDFDSKNKVRVRIEISNNTNILETYSVR